MADQPTIDDAMPWNATSNEDYPDWPAYAFATDPPVYGACCPCERDKHVPRDSAIGVWGWGACEGCDDCGMWEPEEW